jgi:hypothetical protein
MTTGISATYINTKKFSLSGNLTDHFVAGRQVKADCGTDNFKYGIILSSTYVTATNLTEVVLTGDSDNLTTNLVFAWYEAHPHMSDGRPLIRSDTRPLNTQTFFSSCGDLVDSTGKITISGGKALRWDFSNDDDLYTGDEVPSGFKAKELKVNFICPVFLKDGTIYFFDAPWGSYVKMDIMVPTGHYYPNPAGAIPASALGLPGNKMYAQATEDTAIYTYIGKHFLYGDCPMGDELNAEGATVDALPIGWYIRGLIVTLNSDNISKGFASLEMYRCHSAILPGDTPSH